MNQQVRGHNRGSQRGKEGNVGRSLGEQNSQAWRGLQGSFSSSSSTLPHGPSTPLAGAPQIFSSALLCRFSFRTPGGGRQVGRQQGQSRKTLASLVN